MSETDAAVLPSPGVIGGEIAPGRFWGMGAQCLIRKALSSDQIKALIDSSPADIRDSIEEVDRRRTLQFQLFRVITWFGGACGVFFFQSYTNNLWMLALAVACLDAAAYPLLGRVSWFRELNAALFFCDFLVTELMIWHFGLVVTHSIYWLPILLITMTFYLRPAMAVAIGAMGILLHLGVLVAQMEGWLPVGTIAASLHVQEAVLRNPEIAMAGIAMSFFVLPGSLFFSMRVFRLIRQREVELAQANEIIARYVPAQLAEQILSGEHRVDAAPERKKLTVFFSDIKGFTETTDQLEAEDLSRILNEYLSSMAEIAEEHGGTIDKFVGDAIMIFFGAPTATSDRDHALRAVCMAREMQKKMRELGTKWFNEGIQAPFQVRMGINTGAASVGSFGSRGRMDYTAIGNQVNLAARLESECEPGKILISHSTWALVKEEFPCNEKGEIKVKGIHYPVKVYEVA